MPRANRYWLPGHVWHLTHRCHRRQFLLRFGRDRRLWTRWLYEARVRHDLCVLDYIVTGNHALSALKHRVGPRYAFDSAAETIYYAGRFAR